MGHLRDVCRDPEIVSSNIVEINKGCSCLRIEVQLLVCDTYRVVERFIVL